MTVCNLLQLWRGIILAISCLIAHASGIFECSFLRVFRLDLVAHVLFAPQGSAVLFSLLPLHALAQWFGLYPSRWY